ncbi:MAG: hypothetical protein Q8N55_01290 [bacterium]|nr:hypothetical protein [bacterium]
MNGNTITQSQNLNILVRRTVVEVVQEILADPDFGLALTEKVKTRLRNKPKRIISFEQIKKKYC